MKYNAIIYQGSEPVICQNIEITELEGKVTDELRSIAIFQPEEKVLYSVGPNDGIFTILRWGEAIATISQEKVEIMTDNAHDQEVIKQLCFVLL